MTKNRGVYEYPKGSGKFWIQYFVGGRRRRESIGPEKLAIAVREKRMTEIREARFFPELRRRTIRFETLCENFRQRRPGHWSKGMLTVCEGWFAGRLAGAITPQDIEQKLNELVRDGRSPATANRYRAILSAIFSGAMQNGQTNTNPARLVQLRRENNGRIRVLSEAEEQSIRAVIRWECLTREAELDLALNTGMRRGEQYGLAWTDVDLKNGLITLLRTKNGRTRHIPLNAAALASIKLLQNLARGRERVCAPQGNWFKQVAQRAEVGDFRWHDLRHTFASRLVMAGVDLRTVQDLLGHESILMTVKYTHLADSHLRKAVDAIAKPVETGLRIVARDKGSK